MGNQETTEARERRRERSEFNSGSVSSVAVAAVAVGAAAAAAVYLYEYVTTPRQEEVQPDYNELDLIEAHIQKIFKEIERYEQQLQQQQQQVLLLPSDYESCSDALTLVTRLINRIQELKLRYSNPSPVVTKRLISSESEAQLLKMKISKILSNNKTTTTTGDSFDDSECDCPPSFICPITHEIMKDPVLLIESGVTYERSAITKWLLDHNTDPLTNMKLSSKQIVSVTSLRNAICEWLSLKSGKTKVG